MSIRTREDLIDSFDRAMTWRKRELSQLKFLIQNETENEVRHVALIRSATALLYAHWEGSIKQLSEIYLEYVSMQRLQNAELSNCMLAIVLRSRLHTSEHSYKIATHLDLIDFIRSKMEVRSRLPYKGLIKTNSNLSSKVLSEILITLGVESASYLAKSHLLDNRLLAKRNSIAHGHSPEIDKPEYLEVHAEVTALMDAFRNDLENAAISRKFKIVAPEAAR